MNRKLYFSVVVVGLAASTLACGVMNNLVDRAIDEAEEAVIEQVEEQTGQDLPDMDSLQATAAALEDLDPSGGLEGFEDVIPEGMVESGASGFPVMEGASVLLEDETTINYSVTGATLPEAVQFYRDTFTGQGLTERDVTSVIQDAYASMVFDGDPSGQAIIVQIVDLGNGTISISLYRDSV